MIGHGRIVAGGVQMAGMPGEKAANSDKAEQLIREAVRLGAQIVVTPECVLTGHVGGAEERNLAEPIPGPSTERFGRLARELGVAILLGLSELHEGHLYNAAAVLWPDGSLRGVMRQVHIDRHETAGGWRNGGAFPAFDLRTPTGHFRFGIVIGYDREVPEAARILMLQDVDAIFHPLACRCLMVDAQRCLLRTRAFENELYVVAVNHAAPRHNGHSMVLDYEGNIVGEADETEQAFVCEIDIDGLNGYRHGGTHGEHHRRPELYGPLLDPAGQIHPADADLPRDSSARACDI